jgi:hypothetical protein
MSSFSPGLILILGALPVPFLRGVVRQAYMLALPIIGLGSVFLLEPGSHGQMAGAWSAARRGAHAPIGESHG